MAGRGGDKAHVEVRRLARTRMLKGPIPECLKQTFPKGGMLAGLAADAHLCACSLAEWVWKKKKRKKERLKTDYWGEKYFRLETTVSAASGSLPAHSPALMQAWLKGGIPLGTVGAKGLAGRGPKPTPVPATCQAPHRLKYTRSPMECCRPR